MVGDAALDVALGRVAHICADAGGVHVVVSLARGPWPGYEGQVGSGDGGAHAASQLAVGDGFAAADVLATVGQLAEVAGIDFVRGTAAGAAVLGRDAPDGGVAEAAGQVRHRMVERFPDAGDAQHDHLHPGAVAAGPPAFQCAVARLKAIAGVRVLAGYVTPVDHTFYITVEVETMPPSPRHSGR